MEQVAFQKFHASGVVGSSGTPVEIWGSWVGGGQINFHSGTSATGAIFSHAESNATTDVILASAGIVFPSGCYIELGVGAADKTTVFYKTIS